MSVRGRWWHFEFRCVVHAILFSPALSRHRHVLMFLCWIVAALFNNVWRCFSLLSVSKYVLFTYTMVQNILLSLWYPKVHYRAYKSSPPDPILTHPNPVRTIDPFLPLNLTYTSLIPHYWLDCTYPAETPNIPSSKSRVLFQLLRSCRRISPGPRPFGTFRNKLYFYG
jgi:hypothetical protein